MKRFIAIFLLLLPLWAWADKVDVERAQKVALQFVNQVSTTRSMEGVKLVWTGENKTRNLSHAPYYVFNTEQGEGFVIVSGDDCLQPIIGFSREHRFVTENLSPELLYWLQQVEVCIESRQNLPRTRAMNLAWQQVDVGTIEKEIPTALWNQADPYWRMCPEVEGERCYSGCVMTATAIVMRHRQWPEKGVGTLNGYTTYSLQLPIEGHALGHTYHWDKMPMEYGPNPKEDEAQEVAQLMWDLGVMLQADYGTATHGNGTGAYVPDIASVLPVYLGYDESMRCVLRDSYSTEEWVKMLKDEMRKNGPLVYGGVSLQGGHAFVFDGFTSKDYVRVNWGWGGKNNGFFSLDSLDPGDNQGIGGTTEGYTRQQMAILGMVKSSEEKNQPLADIRFLPYEDSMMAIDGMEMLDGTDNVVKNQSFMMAAICANFSKYLFQGYLELRVVDLTGHEKEVVKTWHYKNVQPFPMYFDLTDFFQVSKPIAVGDRLRLMYCLEGDSEWHTVKGGDNCQWEYVLFDEGRVNLNQTPLRYVKSRREVVVTLRPYVRVEVLRMDGTKVEDCVKMNDNRATISLGQLTEDSCQLRLVIGERQRVITLRLPKEEMN